VKVLSEYVKHHVHEEEGEIFPSVRESKMDLAALGEERRDPQTRSSSTITSSRRNSAVNAGPHSSKRRAGTAIPPERSLAILRPCT
jgi:hypothetical protein